MIKMDEKPKSRRPIPQKTTMTGLPANVVKAKSI